VTGPPHLVHGMGRELTAPDWPALTDEEVGEVLGGWVPGGWVPGGWVPGWLPGGQPVVTWRSPRPMSAAALVRQGTVTVFLKRHHVRVRTPAQLAAEHAFAAHLRRRGQPVPLVLHRANGQSVLRRGDYCYEVHQLAEGADLYRTRSAGRRTPAPVTRTQPGRLWRPCTWPRRIFPRRPARSRC